MNANDEQREAEAPEARTRLAATFAGPMDPDRLDEIAAVIERSASWYPAPPSTDLPSAPEATSSPPVELEFEPSPSTPRPTNGKPRLGKKERRELERKQRALAAQRASTERRERRKRRAQLRSERAAASPELAARRRPATKENEPRLESSPARKWRVPWASIAVLLFPLGAALRTQRLGGAVLSAPFFLLASAAVVVAWFVRKR